jgi:hypothetical protein
VDGKRRKISIGVIVRNHEGGVIAMMNETINFIQDPVTAEALAARRAVEFSRMLGVGELILEGDALQIVEALQSEDGGRSLYGIIIEDVLQLMRSFLVAPQILIVLFLIYLFDNIILLISLRSLWYYGGW